MRKILGILAAVLIFGGCNPFAEEEEWKAKILNCGNGVKSSDILGWSVSTPRYLKDDSTGVMDMYFSESDKKYDGGKLYPIRLIIRTRTITDGKYFEELE